MTPSSWQRLIEQPLGFVSRDSLEACLGASLSSEQAQGLLDGPRFASRLSQRLMRHWHLAPLETLPAPDEADLTVLLLAPKQWARLPRLCGAVWHGATLSREIRGEVLTPLRAELGADVYAQALAHRQLAGAANLLREPAQLIEVIDRDGAACVDTWLREQPPALQGWLRLRLPGSGEEPSRVPKAGEIVRAMARVLTTEQEAL